MFVTIYSCITINNNALVISQSTNSPNKFFHNFTNRCTHTMSRRVSFSPEPDISSKSRADSVNVAGGKKTLVLRIWTFKVPKESRFQVGRLGRNIRTMVAGALQSVSAGRRCSCKVLSSASLPRSRSYAETLDSQRAEAIEDCIEFFNSSSLQRSNSVAKSK